VPLRPDVSSYRFSEKDVLVVTSMAEYRNSNACTLPGKTAKLRKASHKACNLLVHSIGELCNISWIANLGL
jgi:hypothetical protein